MKISIVTPSYNQAQFLAQTIESVISQKGDFEIEYIIADGGSTDNSAEIIQKYDLRLRENSFPIKCKNVKLIWWSKKDKGQSSAINIGLKKATGDIIAYINSDDYYLDNTFTKVLSEFAKRPDSCWSTGYCRVVDDKSQEIQKYITNYKKWWLDHYSYNKLLITNFICQPATFWKREITQKCGLIDESLNYTMDYDYWLRIGRKHQPVIIKEPLACFRVYSKSKMGAGFQHALKSDLIVARRNTDNRLIIFLHSTHNLLTFISYKMQKR